MMLTEIEKQINLIEDLREWLIVLTLKKEGHWLKRCY